MSMAGCFGLEPCVGLAGEPAWFDCARVRSFGTPKPLEVALGTRKKKREDEASKGLEESCQAMPPYKHDTARAASMWPGGRETCTAEKGQEGGEREYARQGRRKLHFQLLCHYEAIAPWVAASICPISSRA